MSGANDGDVTGSRPLRERGHKLVAAVHHATLALLSERGYARMEIPEIAERAQVNKTSIYRRWPGKAELVRDVALTRMRMAVPLPDTGHVVGDLTALLVAIAEVLASPFAGELLRALVGMGEREPEVRQVIAGFWDERFAVSGVLVERAIQRHELPVQTSVRALLEFAAAPLFFRALVTGEALTPAELAQIAQRTVRAFQA